MIVLSTSITGGDERLFTSRLGGTLGGEYAGGAIWSDNEILSSCGNVGNQASTNTLDFRWIWESIPVSSAVETASPKDTGETIFSAALIRTPVTSKASMLSGSHSDRGSGTKGSRLQSSTLHFAVQFQSYAVLVTVSRLAMKSAGKEYSDPGSVARTVSISALIPAEICLINASFSI